MYVELFQGSTRILTWSSSLACQHTLSAHKAGQLIVIRVQFPATVLYLAFGDTMHSLRLQLQAVPSTCSSHKHVSTGSAWVQVTAAPWQILLTVQNPTGTRFRAQYDTVPHVQLIELALSLVRRVPTKEAWCRLSFRDGMFHPCLSHMFSCRVEVK